VVNRLVLDHLGEEMNERNMDPKRVDTPGGNGGGFASGFEQGLMLCRQRGMQRLPFERA